MEPAQDLHVLEMVPLISPNDLKCEIPTTPKAAETVAQARIGVRNIFHRQDDRLLLIVGPCSIMVRTFTRLVRKQVGWHRKSCAGPTRLKCLSRT